MNHPQIARVCANAICLRRYGLCVMELATGNLVGWCQRRRAKDWELRLHILRQAASGLEHLHAKGLTGAETTVKSASFFVFADDDSEKCPTVKLCVLGISIG